VFSRNAVDHCMTRNEFAVNLTDGASRVFECFTCLQPFNET
jgi:hypothetical protein